MPWGLDSAGALRAYEHFSSTSFFTKNSDVNPPKDDVAKELDEDICI